MKIKKLKLENHPLFNDTSVFFSKENSKESSNYKTVIIGPNGTGKSSLLSCVVDILVTELSEQKEKIVKKVDYDYELEFESSSKYTITKESCFENIDVNKIIAVTNTYNDRFHFPSKRLMKHTDRYDYLGLKTASNNIFFSSVKEDIFEMLALILRDESKIESTKKLLRELGFGGAFEIDIELGRNFKKFKGEAKLNENRFGDVSLKKYIESERYENSIIEVDDIISMIEDRKRINMCVDFELISDYEDLEYTDVVLDLINNKIISVKKLSLFSVDGYDMSEASSGEFNILRIFLSIISRLDNNSLIVIDEPEISLHPNWQINFCDLLDIIMSAYSSCHVIIATHSHFILSNLKPENSMIVSLLPSSQSRKSYIDDSSDLNSYGLSPENTLYKFFGVTGFNNKYFEMDLRVIINYISNPKEDEYDAFKSAFSRVNEFKISEDSPLISLLKKASEMLSVGE